MYNQRLKNATSGGLKKQNSRDILTGLEMLLGAHRSANSETPLPVALRIDVSLFGKDYIF
jgi:hypothetical protein